MHGTWGLSLVTHKIESSGKKHAHVRVLANTAVLAKLAAGNCHAPTNAKRTSEREPAICNGDVSE
jgi:hypothetical protein